MAAGVVADRTPGIASGRWIVRTFLGWSAGFVLAIASLVGAESLGLREVQFPLALGMGLGVGLLQGRLVAPWLGTRSWTVATAAGLSAPFMAADLMHVLGRPVPFMLSGYVAVGGVLVAVLQWRLLRAFGTRAGWWLVLTPVGWLLAGSTVWINELVLPRTPGLVGALQYVAVVLSGGVVLGAIGAVAWRLLIKPG